MALSKSRKLIGTIVALVLIAAFVIAIKDPAYDAGYKLGHAIRGLVR